MGRTELHIQDVDKYASKVCSAVVKTISKELTTEAINLLEAFYNSYQPKYYDRWEHFIRGYRPQRYYHNGGNRFDGGVHLLVDSIPQIYQDNSSEVAGYVYYGLHGPASLYGDAPIMKPSPMSRLEKKRDEIVDNIQKYIDWHSKGGSI